MPPVTASSAGITRQTIDDPELVELIDCLSRFDVLGNAGLLFPPDNAAAEHPKVDIDGLTTELSKWQTWRFQEQVDLYEWIHPLNVMDAALTDLMLAHPSLLLIAPSSKTKKGWARTRPNVVMENSGDYRVQAESLEDVSSVPNSVNRQICIILRFLTNLLRNSTNKAVFNSVDEVVDLLATADDAVASLALEVLSSLATPSMLHRQQVPEVQHQSTVLHSRSSAAPARLLALARGWGSRGTGLGLYTCATTDDSVHGQGALPRYAGELNFEYYFSNPSDGDKTPSRVISIHLATEDIIKSVGVTGSTDSCSDTDGEGASKPKRRRIKSPGAPRDRFITTKSTADLFFNCLAQAGGRECVPAERVFTLLADVRLAKSFHSNVDRVAGVERRLRALIAILHSHPSQDVLSGYFAAQPELCVEFVDLVKPTVSASAVSSGPLPPSSVGGNALEPGSDADRISAIAAVANSPIVPYTVRTLAIETLTALVARRDVNGGLTNVARQSNVLSELGVGKGRFLGLLPTLIRYALASLNSFLTRGNIGNGPGRDDPKANGALKTEDPDRMSIDEEDDLDINLGLAFLEATKPPPLPPQVQEERALEFIDAVLTLTSAVISVPLGTSALTDCGFIPALISTVALHSDASTLDVSSDGTKQGGLSYSGCLMNFITAQAIQILEGGVVTHGNALTAFHDLKGVDVLVRRLDLEIQKIKRDGGEPLVAVARAGGVQMEIDSAPTTGNRPLRASRRVLLFSIVNCLTVVFHQQESSTSNSITSGGTQLRKPELTNALIDIMHNMSSYGPVVAALAGTLLSDIMNSEPQVVYHVHESGLAKAYLQMVMATEEISDDDGWSEPSLPPCAELIMGIPNVISALALTEAGAKAVSDINPFPAFLSILCSPAYAMPTSRCLLDEATAIIGTSLDEMMRHVPNLRPQIMQAIVNSIRRIVSLDQKLAVKESKANSGFPIEDPPDPQYSGTTLEMDRSHIMHYTNNIGQVLEHILHSDDHVGPFVDAGGLDVILEMRSLLLPNENIEFLSHVSCMSCPSVSTLTHATTTNTLSMVLKSVAANYECNKMIRQLIDLLEKQLDALKISQGELRRVSSSSEHMGDENIENRAEFDASGILESVPRLPLHEAQGLAEYSSINSSLSRYLRDVAKTEWLTNTLATLIRNACQRTHEIGPSWGPNDREWKKEISSSRFEALMVRLSSLHRTSMLEACRIRTESDFESRDLKRRQPPGEGYHPAIYKLRIVCQEGAVLRDGIEIDSCASVGSLEMGQIIEAFDRCINSSGVMRYKTSRGWLSEQTRGHGREQIAEVLSIRGVVKGKRAKEDKVVEDKLIECGIPDLCSVSASVIARLHHSHTDLLSCLTRVVIHGMRSLPSATRALSFQQGAVGAHVGAVVRVMSNALRENFDLGLSHDQVICALKTERVKSMPQSLNDQGVAMYLGAMLSIFHSCLYDEKRERRMMNLPLLLHIMNAYGLIDEIVISPEVSDDDDKKPAASGPGALPSIGFLGAIRYVLKVGLQDMSNFAKHGIMAVENPSNQDAPATFQYRQRVSRSVAASFPSTIVLLKRLVSRTLIIDSQISKTLSRIKTSEFESLVGISNETSVNLPKTPRSKSDGTTTFKPSRFARTLHCMVADVVYDLWNDPLLKHAPAHIVHPVLYLVGETLTSLDAGGKPSPGEDVSSSGDGGSSEILDLQQRLQQRLSRNISAMNAFLDDSPPGARTGRDNEITGRGSAPARPRRPQPFEASEESITRMAEMGFSRDHALEALETVESNRVEIAMEYALVHPPPSPTSIERRNRARELRRRQQAAHEAREAAASASAPSESLASRMRVVAADSGVATGAAADGESMDIDEDASGQVEGARSAQDHNIETSKSAGPSAAKEKILTEEEQKAARQKKIDLNAISRTNDRMESLKAQLVTVSLNIITHCNPGGESSTNTSVVQNTESANNEFDSDDGDSEALTVVVSCFLLEICERYPDNSAKVAGDLVSVLNSCIGMQENQDACKVHLSRENEFASLCHASVIFMRAMPKFRPMILRHGLVQKLLQCIQCFLTKHKNVAATWPKWLASCLLLLGVMAQPTVSILTEEGPKEEEEDTNPEYKTVVSEHKEQAAAIAKTAHDIFNSLNSKATNAEPRKKKVKDQKKNNKKKDGSTIEAENVIGDSTFSSPVAQPKSVDEASPFAKIPPYLPLLSFESTETSMNQCLRLLETAKTSAPASSIIHAILVLLSSVLRSHKLASSCLKLGAAEQILSLPASCRFDGSTGVVSVILRRMLEDESTLQVSMETEIRGTVIKLHKKQNSGSANNTDNERPYASARPFIQAITPLICRDPFIFLKAAASSIKFEKSDSGATNGAARIILLSSEERTKHSKALLELSGSTHLSGSSFNNSTCLKKPGHNSSSTQKKGSSHSSKNQSTSKSSKNKSPRHPQLKRGKSPSRLKRDRSDKRPGASAKRTISVNGSPSNHITSLLLSEMIMLAEKGIANWDQERVSSSKQNEPLALTAFFWTVEYLEILADLVLAVPACAAAIHRYRLHLGKESGSSDPPKRLCHALSGCPSPPENAVSFLLHVLLPQPRLGIQKMKSDRLMADTTEDEKVAKRKKTEFYIKAKLSQNAARLLVALVARAGEGRKRVISDLEFALSGGWHGIHNEQSGISSDISNASNEEMWALQSWGELCIGLAAPRSSSSSNDSNSSLSFDVVKLMGEVGMAHALMYAIERVNLQHPMAANTAGALIRPIEVFTRGTVVDTLQEMADKEVEEKNKTVGKSSKKKSSGSTRRITFGPSQQSEASFADDAMIEDGFDAETGERNARRSARRRDRDMIEEMVLDDMEAEILDEEEEELEEAEEEELSDDSDDDSDDIEVRLGDPNENVTSSGSEDGEESDDSEGNSESDSSNEESEDDVSDAGSAQQSESGSDDEVSDESSSVDEDESGWEEEAHDDFFDGASHVVDEDRQGDEAGAASMPSDSDIDGDWTRIEAGGGGGGGRLLGVRQPLSALGAIGHENGRNGLIVDAAEAMLGNILRAGDMQMDALTEIENSLGIRIRHRGSENGDSSFMGLFRGSGVRAETSTRSEGQGRDDRRNVVGMVPTVNQTNQRDIPGTGSGRWGDTNPIEYIYGGPSITAGSTICRNYDLTSLAGEPTENSDLILPSAIDTQLFPGGGPAASTHARTQQQIHPLLRGVELPPANALVSTLVPHNIRSVTDRHRGQSTISGPTEFMANTNGTIVRVNRGGQGWLEDTSTRTSGFGTGTGIGGWTDDGQPLDNTAESFSVAFEQALEEAMTRSSGLNTGPAPEAGAPAVDTDIPAPGNANGSEGMPAGANQDSVLERASSELETSADSFSNDQHESSNLPPLEGAAEMAENDIISAPNEMDESTGPVNNNVIEENASAGELPSLAAGLALSPRNESSTSDQNTPNHITVDEQPSHTETQESAGTVSGILGSSDASNHDQVQENMEVQSETEALGTNQAHTETSETVEPARGSDTETGQDQPGNEPNQNGLVCPPGIDPEVFNSLPVEMQQELVDQHQTTQTVAAQLDSASGLDPEALAALPEEMRREVIAQEQIERQRDQAPADPSNAEEMDNASFIASLAPELRTEILLTADEAFLNSLPPNIIAEAQILRERASSHHRRIHEEAAASSEIVGGQSRPIRHGRIVDPSSTIVSAPSKKKGRTGKIRVECDRSQILYLPPAIEKISGPLLNETSAKSLIRLMYLLVTVRPHRLLQKLISNVCANPDIRRVFLKTFVCLLNNDGTGAASCIRIIGKEGLDHESCVSDQSRASLRDSEFPPSRLIGAAPGVVDSEGYNGEITMFRTRHSSSAASAIVASLPAAALGSSINSSEVPPVVAKRIIDTLSFLSKNSPRSCLDMLKRNEEWLQDTKMPAGGLQTGLDQLLDLLGLPLYNKSSTNLEQLLVLLEGIVTPLWIVPRDGEEQMEMSQKELENASQSGKEWVDVPRVVVTQRRLHLLCSILRMESGKDTSFAKVNNITKRLCRVDSNRACILGELASVAQGLGADAIRDLRALGIRLDAAVKLHKKNLSSPQTVTKNRIEGDETGPDENISSVLGIPSSAVTLSTSSSELKLLRVLQILTTLTTSHDEISNRRNDGSPESTAELVSLFQSINLEALWDELSSCLRVVSVLEGVAHVNEKDAKGVDDEADGEGEAGDDGEGEGDSKSGKKLQNSVAGLLTRFLPTIEAFFVVNGSATGDSPSSATKASLEMPGSTVDLENESPLKNISQSPEVSELDKLVDGNRLVHFVAENKVLLNALLRNNSSLLDKGLKSMVKLQKCRPYLDFDVKRQWFKTQVRRLRQHASRRHGSLRLSIRRKHVFEDAYHQLRLRNADEMRGRLHITFRNEEGVDAGGLSREFFGILAKEMFNPNYALFTSTEDGCTFQPNPNSNINPDHLHYFRFVGRIVGKAVADGFLLDAHFTRSLYKHMLGVKPTHHDMEAIDPDYYKNLKMILEYNLADIGLDLTFSTEEYIFGRSQTIDLIPGGRKTHVTEENKAKYVSLVCQHRMTTAIQSQIKAYLEGFHELVKPDLISIFTAKELELLISGMPDIDIDDLKKNTDYNGYKATDKEIGWFWNIMFSLSRSEKAAFLQFVTGSSKVPLAGFSEIQGMRGVQKFSIHKASGSKGALMSAHTCFNSLDLPVYISEEEMREKLLYSISEAGSFAFA